MSIHSALPGLWAGCIAAAALAGTMLYRQPAPEAPLPEPQDLIKSDQVITTIFNQNGVAGHVSVSLSYRVEAERHPTATLEAVASDRLLQTALTHAHTFTGTLADAEMMERFIKQQLTPLEGYVVETVHDAQFHPFQSGQ